MKNTYRLLLAAGLAALSLTACKKEEAKTEETVVVAPVAVPAGEDKAAWQPYLASIAKANMEGVVNAPYAYFLPGESSADFQGEYDRLLERVQMDMSRGIIEGNMLVFASPAQEKMTEMIETAFKPVPEASMKGVKVVFIGTPILGERVKAAVSAAGVNYVFVEAK